MTPVRLYIVIDLLVEYKGSAVKLILSKPLVLVRGCLSILTNIYDRYLKHLRKIVQQLFFEVILSK